MLENRETKRDYIKIMLSNCRMSGSRVGKLTHAFHSKVHQLPSRFYVRRRENAKSYFENLRNSKFPEEVKSKLGLEEEVTAPIQVDITKSAPH